MDGLRTGIIRTQAYSKGFQVHCGYARVMILVGHSRVYRRKIKWQRLSACPYRTVRVSERGAELVGREGLGREPRCFPSRLPDQ